MEQPTTWRELITNTFNAITASHGGVQQTLDMQTIGAVSDDAGLVQVFYGVKLNIATLRTLHEEAEPYTYDEDH
jgi:hypothetical protein